MEFVSEPIEVEAGTFSTDMMLVGLASLPSGFVWRGKRYGIVECLDHVKQSMPEGHTAGGERYLRRQSFEVVLDTGQRARIYFERQGRGKPGSRSVRSRWFLYGIVSGGEDSDREAAEGR